MILRFFVLTIFASVACIDLCGDEATDKETKKERSREARLAAYLSNSKFVGKFTVDGKDVPPKTEEYLISKCEKLEAENMYRLTARIRYGSTDQEVPLEIKILFAGETPVITLDGLWIPGMGTFDSRVLIRRDRYAGSWQHGQNGGHLFGKIVPADETDEAVETKETEDQK